MGAEAVSSNRCSQVTKGRQAPKEVVPLFAAPVSLKAARGARPKSGVVGLRSVRRANGGMASNQWDFCMKTRVSRPSRLVS